MRIKCKHPDTDEIATADFAQRLAEGEELASVVTTQPSVVRKTPETATDPTFGTAVVNDEEIAVPMERPVKARQGVQFSASGGDHGATYWIKVEATTTTAGRSVAVEVPLKVDRFA
jgi:hypothetical protein